MSILKIYTEFSDVEYGFGAQWVPLSASWPCSRSKTNDSPAHIRLKYLLQRTRGKGVQGQRKENMLQNN